MILDSSMFWFMSDIKTRNNIGPSTVPWGTPLITMLSSLTPPGNDRIQVKG